MSTHQTIVGSSLDFSKMVKKLVIILPIGFLISLTFSIGVSDRDLLSIITKFSPRYFTLVIVLILLPWFANTLRLFIWTRFFGTKLSFIQTYKIILVSEFGAAISPSAVGGAPVKTGLLIQEKMSSGAALSLATITTFEDFAFFVIAVPVALTLSSAWNLPFLNILYEKLQTNLTWLVALALIITFMIFLAIKIMLKFNSNKINNQADAPLSFFQRVLLKGKKVSKDFKAAYVVIGKRGKFRFMTTTALTGIQWICRHSVITALAASLGLHTEPVLFFALQFIVFTLSVFVPTPGATGGAEALFYLIFNPFLPQNSLGLLTAGWRFLTFYMFLGIGITTYLLLLFFERVTKKIFHFLSFYFHPTTTEGQIEN